eukprot:scaffold9027_cov86-Skeletonema_dohrnii-CCMP3373.AAC.1
MEITLTCFSGEGGKKGVRVRISHQPAGMTDRAKTTSELLVEVTHSLPGELRGQAIVVDDHQPPATHSTKVSYVTSFWAKVKGKWNNPHRREVVAALLANIHNTHFDQVVVYLDREDDAESCLDFRQAMSDLSRQVFSMTAEESNKLLTNKLKCVDVQTGQPSYYQIFSNALSDEVIGDVVVLATWLLMIPCHLHGS